MSEEDYNFIRRLGEGGFGVVYEVRHKSGNTFAMKKGKRTGNFQAEQNEIEVLLSLKIHRHIVQMVEYFVDTTNTHLCIVMEFCDGGNLEQYVIEKQPESHLTSVFMLQMADAVQYLHMNGIIHRDLKPENVLLVKQNNHASVKVADFGIAKIADPILPGQAPVNYMKTKIGTPYYQAPEVYDRHYTEKADVFSLGVIYCAILERLVIHGKRLVIFYDHETVKPIGEVLHGDQSAIRTLSPDIQIDSEIRNLINKMIVPLYKIRPTAADVHNTLKRNLRNRNARQTRKSKQTTKRSKKDIKDTVCCRCMTWTCRYCCKAFVLVLHVLFFCWFACDCCPSCLDCECRTVLNEELGDGGRLCACICSAIAWIIIIALVIIYFLYGG